MLAAVKQVTSLHPIASSCARQAKNPIFWTDNCSAQNKNWVFYTALAQIVNSDWGPDSVTVKYLQTGHTFMAADNVHGTIGKNAFDE